METMLFQYATFNGTNLITITSAGLTTNALIGSWILFPTENYLLSGASTPNYSGVLAWGRITANDATTITAAVSGAATVPLATDKCLIVHVPRMDFSSDLAETTAVRSFTNNLNIVKFTNSDNKDDLFTKVIAKAKSSVPVWLSSSKISPEGTVLSAALSAKDLWDPSTGFFENSTYITQKTEGYIYSYAAGGTTLIVIGQGYALANGDTIWYFGIRTDGTTTFGALNLSATPTTQTQVDGTLTTTLTFATAPDASYSWAKHSVFFGAKTYVKDASVYMSPYNNFIGAFGGQRTYAVGGTSALYGPYMVVTGLSDPVLPHLQGCIISKQTYTEVAPQTGSPVQFHGVITKPITPDTSISPPDLEILACNCLIQGSQYYQKSTATISYYQFTINRVRDGVQLTGPAMIREGQRISIIPATGVTAIERQVVGWEFDASTMTFKLTLGDYIKDIYNTINANTAATQKALI